MNEKKLLKRLKVLSPKTFNALKFSHRMNYFVAVFNEYIKKVAIPKKWEFTETIKEFPTGKGEDEFIDEETGNVAVEDKKWKLIMRVLEYADLGIFALKNYGLMIESDTKPIEGSDLSASTMSVYKVSKPEAQSFINVFLKDREKYNAMHKSQKWDMSEKAEEEIFDMIKRWYEYILSGGKDGGIGNDEYNHILMYIIHSFAKEKGIPTSYWNRDKDVDVDIDELVKENIWVSEQVLKHRDQFLIFSIVNYAIAVYYAKKKNRPYLMVVNPDISDMIDKLYDSDSELTDEEKKKIIQIMDADFAKMEKMRKKLDKGMKKDEILNEFSNNKK